MHICVHGSSFSCPGCGIACIDYDTFLTHQDSCQAPLADKDDRSDFCRKATASIGGTVYSPTNNNDALPGSVCGEEDEGVESGAQDLSLPRCAVSEEKAAAPSHKERDKLKKDAVGEGNGDIDEHLTRESQMNTDEARKNIIGDDRESVVVEGEVENLEEMMREGEDDGEEVEDNLPVHFMVKQGGSDQAGCSSMLNERTSQSPVV